MHIISHINKTNTSHITQYKKALRKKKNNYDTTRDYKMQQSALQHKKRSTAQRKKTQRSTTMQNTAQHSKYNIIQNIITSKTNHSTAKHNTTLNRAIKQTENQHVRKQQKTYENNMSPLNTKQQKKASHFTIQQRTSQHNATKHTRPHQNITQESRTNQRTPQHNSPQQNNIEHTPSNRTAHYKGNKTQDI